MAGLKPRNAARQLSLPFLYERSSKLAAVGSGNRLCSLPGEREALRSFILGTPAYEAASAISPVEIALDCGRAG